MKEMQKKPTRKGRPANSSGGARAGKRSPKTQVEIHERHRRADTLREAKVQDTTIGVILAVSRQRVRELVKQGERLRKTEIRYNSRIVPPVVKLAMDRGGFATPGDVAEGIRDGTIKLTRSKFAGSTVSGIGKAKFLELCAFFDIDPQTLPDAIPIETRIASKINDAVPLDLAFAEVVRSNVYTRQTIKLVARLTCELTSDGLRRLQDWGKA